MQLEALGSTRVPTLLSIRIKSDQIGRKPLPNINYMHRGGGMGGGMGGGVGGGMGVVLW